MVLPGPARLSVRALAWLLDVERIGAPHLVLAPAAVWHPPGEWDARGEIAALGWYDRCERLEIEVAAALAVLCGAESEFFGWISHEGTTIGILAAGIGRHGLLAVRDGESVWLNRVGRAVLADTLVAQTPEMPAGEGKPVAVSLNSTQRHAIVEAAVRVGPAGVAVRRVRQLAELPTTGSGELYAAVRDGLGRYRVSEPVRYADTRQGRYLNLTTGPGDVLVAPASRADLVARLKERRRSLSR